MSLSDELPPLRRPEYTGENRCLPCTAVNAAIAVAVAGFLAVALPLGGTEAVALGGAVLLAAGLAIYLRGYLVPGTPWFTRTVLPDRVLRYFEHAPKRTQGEDSADPADILEAAGAVTECVDVDDLCLTDEFRTAWDARIDELRGTEGTRTAFASLIDVAPAAVTLEDRHGSFAAFVERSDVTGRIGAGQWESSGAFLADMAAAEVLTDRFPGWKALPVDERASVLNGLRIFLEDCPSCGGPVTFGEDTVDSCCRSVEVLAVSCDDCGDRLFEAERPERG